MLLDFGHNRPILSCGCSQLHPPPAVGGGLDCDGREVVKGGEVQAVRDEMHGCLLGHRPAAPAPVVASGSPSRQDVVNRPGNVGRGELAEIVTLRQHDRVRGEPISPDVRNLPREIGISSRNRGDYRATPDGTTGVVTTVGADCDDWTARPPSGGSDRCLRRLFVVRRNRQPVQLVVPDPLAEHPFPARPAVGKQEPPAVGDVPAKAGWAASE